MAESASKKLCFLSFNSKNNNNNNDNLSLINQKQQTRNFTIYQ